jgi:hypothetical protein
MREWDPEAGPCESCDEDLAADDESQADASAFFPDDLERVNRRGHLSPVTEEVPGRRSGSACRENADISDGHAEHHSCTLNLLEQCNLAHQVRCLAP